MQKFEKHQNKTKKDSSNIERMRLLLKTDRQTQYIKSHSNVIQYDDMGYLLRLIINKYGEQEWIYSHEEDGDVVLEWSNVWV